MLNGGAIFFRPLIEVDEFRNRRIESVCDGAECPPLFVERSAVNRGGATKWQVMRLYGYMVMGLYG